MHVRQRRTFTAGQEEDVTLVGNVYHVPFGRSGWTKLKEERRQTRPATVPRPDPAFFIIVDPRNDDEWVIGRIPSMKKDVLDAKPIEIARTRELFVVSKRLVDDAPGSPLIPIRYIGESTNRVLRNGAIQNCIGIAHALCTGPSVILDKLSKAVIDNRPNYLAD
jgi:hypothetical protein